MQSLIVISIYDIKSGTYSKPMYALNMPVAQRMFVEACADPDTYLRKSPEDYTLYQLGTFDDSSGELKSDKKSIMTAEQAIYLVNEKEVNSTLVQNSLKPRFPDAKE